MVRNLDTNPVPVNPFGKSHGAPRDTERHVGDLGNIETDAQGNSAGSAEDHQVKLIGPESVLGVSSPNLAAMLPEEHADEDPYSVR
jgi:Cu/Zn superoxide dismutase